MDPSVPDESLNGPADPRGFPITKEDFNTDTRVSFSRLSGKYTLEQDDGSEFEFDEGLRRWIPVVSFFCFLGTKSLLCTFFLLSFSPSTPCPCLFLPRP